MASRHFISFICLWFAYATVLPAWANPDSQSADSQPRSDEEYYELFELFVDSMDQIERNYVKPVDRRELVEAAIEGMLDELDPYSSYVPPEELAEFRKGVESSFAGIGIQVAKEQGQLIVVSPIVGSPAYKAGVIAGDAITKINDEPTDNLDLNDAIKMLKGDIGTEVAVTIRHADEKELKTYTIQREIVKVETVLGDRRNQNDSWDFMYDGDQGIGYVRVTAFGRDTAKNLRTALRQLEMSNVRGLILDLRFNPGGLLTSAIDTSDLFLEQGTIVSTAGRNAPQRSWEAQRDGTFVSVPIVVLVNRYSASASEIVAASLQDNDRALIVGERTWGKGSVQNVIELEGGKSILKLTTASYQRPNGHNIHRFHGANDSDEWGVAPDDGYHLRLDSTELGRLLRDRRDRDIVKPHQQPEASSDHDPRPEPSSEPTAVDATPEIEVPPDNFVDRQLQLALKYLIGELAKTE